MSRFLTGRLRLVWTLRVWNVQRGPPTGNHLGKPEENFGKKRSTFVLRWSLVAVGVRGERARLSRTETCTGVVAPARNTPARRTCT